MTDEGLFRLFLFLHVLGAIVAFGPALSFGLIGAFGGKEPQHSNFTMRLSDMLARRVVIPVALTMPITGAAMIFFGKIDLTNPAFYWLDLAIVLYVIAILYAVFIQTPAVAKLIELTSGGPPPGAPAGPPVGAMPGATSSATPGVRPGPPPHIAAALKRVQQGGMLIGALIVLIVLLMVVKPRF
jgi:hypothetical protein